jgi:hypothetical protein
VDDGPLPQDFSLPDLCDLCHQAIEPGATVYGKVRDSSFAHPADPEQDGRRLLIACSVSHLADLQQQDRDRPFVNEELWLLKIDRAMRQHPNELTTEQFAKATGLNLLQLEAAATWRLHRGDSAVRAPRDQ